MKTRTALACVALAAGLAVLFWPRPDPDPEAQRRQRRLELGREDRRILDRLAARPAVAREVRAERLTLGEAIVEFHDLGGRGTEDLAGCGGHVVAFVRGLSPDGPGPDLASLLEAELAELVREGRQLPPVLPEGARPRPTSTRSSCCSAPTRPRR